MSWNDPDLLAQVAKFIPYAFIVLGGLVAVSGQFVRDRMELRITALRETAEQERMNTPPRFDLSAGHDTETGEKLLVLEFLKDIPIRFNWYVLTQDNRIRFRCAHRKDRILSHRRKPKVLVPVTHQRRRRCRQFH